MDLTGYRQRESAVMTARQVRPISELPLQQGLDDSEIMHADEQPDRGAGNPTQLAEKGRKVSGRGAIPSSLSPDAESEVIVHGVAQYLHCHYSTIYRLVEHRQLPGFRLGGNWRFLRRISESDRGQLDALCSQPSLWGTAMWRQIVDHRRSERELGSPSSWISRRAEAGRYTTR